MQATAQSIYAVFAIAYISTKNKPVKASEIASIYPIPRRFLELTLIKLKNSKILNSKKGPNGGFFLTKTPKEISLFDILRETENNLTLFDCEKYLQSNCKIKPIFEIINEEYIKLLKSITLEDIIKSQPEEILDFVI